MDFSLPRRVSGIAARHFISGIRNPAVPRDSDSHPFSYLLGGTQYPRGYNYNVVTVPERDRAELTYIVISPLVQSRTQIISNQYFLQESELPTCSPL